MSLPCRFVDESIYFEESLKFLKTYQYLYNYANTEVLVQNVLETIDITTAENTNVFREDFDIHCLAEIKSLLNELENLTPVYPAPEYPRRNSEYFVNVPLGGKKKHEINNLSQEIHKQCERSSCSTIVDFGSGLGYLDQLLYKRFNYRVLGIENSKACVKGAEKRQRDYHMDSAGSVKYVRHTIDENSNTFLEEALKEHFPGTSNVCMVGLHSCADLTVYAMSLFLNVESAKSLVLMPCCYHKLAREGRDGDAESGSSVAKGKNHKFYNFPVSEKLKAAYENNGGSSFLRVPFLRLATQPPCEEELIEVLVFRLLARATLQLYCHRHNWRLMKKKRRAVKLSKQTEDFASYVEDAIQNGYTLLCGHCTEHETPVPRCECNNEFNTEELTSLWRKLHTDVTRKKAAILILLQRHLQPMSENLVLLDRVVYMRERGVQCRAVKICEEHLSPRCYALVAVK